ncbi:nucleotide exchange factor SIL1 [Ischnura elegans]|uniref:nucleotide exchange factor SIL1 n=1 Tax=Ischnura elegans TaxID=197161 RepID=UPI001ED87838|nr:nucleotide exchange factor SIL1 [Ischnura elegans]
MSPFGMGERIAVFILICCLVCVTWCESEINKISDEEEGAENVPFIPTKEWQRVRKGQAIPAGIHSRLNLQTGVVEAKLLDEDNGEHTALTSVPEKSSDFETVEASTHSKNTFNHAQLQEKLHKIPEEVWESNSEEDDVKKNFRSYEELKKEFKDLKLSIKTDSEIISELWERFKEVTQSKEIVNILTDLEYLLHQTDNAVNFAKDGGIKSIVLPAINSSNNEVVIMALRLLGSATQSNPKVQIAALEAGAVERALRLVKEPQLSSSALHALSCIIRRFPLAQKTFVKYGGPAILAELFDDFPKMGSKAWDDLNLLRRARIKAVTLLHDMILEHQQAEGEARLQYSQVGLAEQITSHNWCKLFPSLLTLEDDHDAVEKGAEAMLAYWETCRSEFVLAAPTVFQAEKRYADLSVAELQKVPTSDPDDSLSSPSGYFSGMAELISHVGKRLRLMKEEL